MRPDSLMLIPVALVAAIGCGDKEPAEAAAPITGWHAEDGWAAQCWFPVDYDQVQETAGQTARAEARQKALEAMMSQWQGQRDDGVAMRAAVIENVEITLLGRPTLIEEVSRQNADHCRTAMMAGASTEEGVTPTVGDLGPWKHWFGTLNGDLNEGECRGGLEDTLFYYLEITTDWQLDVPVCANTKFMIRATEGDKYRISDDGPWINADGDPSLPTSGTDAPCNQEGCYAGMMMIRFTTDTGIETLIPGGVETIFSVPAHGRLSVRINDTTYFDNTWYKSGGIIDHTAVEISPR